MNKRDNAFYFVAFVVSMGLVVVFLFAAVLPRVEWPTNPRQAMRDNTERVLAAPASERILLRDDGTYYSKTSNRTRDKYNFSVIEQGEIKEQTVLTRPDNLAVKIISDGAEPRVETRKCIVAPKDPNAPYDQGMDPHGGGDPFDTLARCVDTMTIHVPEGYIAVTQLG